MTIKEAFQQLANATKKGMKNPFFIMRSLNKNFSEIADKIEGGGGGGINYSTNEQDTGLKWIDGSAIYQKTFEVQSITVGSWVRIAHGISNLGTVIDFSGIISRPADNWSTPLNYYADANSYILSEINPTNVEIKVTFASGIYKAYLTLKYTKATA